MIRAVLLDVDNTLLDFGACSRASMLAAAGDFGLTLPENAGDVFHRVNDRLWLEIEAGRLTIEGLRDVRWQTILGELGIDFDGAVFENRFRERLNESAEPVEGAVELLGTLRQKGYTLCAASNGPYAQQVNRLEKAGMLAFFSHLFISGGIGAAKPSRAFFDACLKELPGIRPEEIMMIGDSLTADIGGAQDYGLATCWFNIQGKPLPEDVKPDHIVKDLGEIREIL